MPTDAQTQDTPGRPSMTKGSRLVSLLAGFLKFVLIAAAVLFSFWLGTRLASPQPASTTVDAGKAQGEIEYWTCSMHPQVRQPGPGNCPICGMELIPVRKAGQQPRVQKTKYACAMMCLPPLDHPGKCPVCGMEMVPVDGGAERAESDIAPNAISEITLTPAAQRLAKLTVAPVERKFVSTEIRMVGKVDYDETHVRTISSRVPGRLDRLYVDYTGVPVRQGDHLVSIYSPELVAAQEELIQALKGFRRSGQNSSEEVRRIRSDTLEATRQKLLLWGLTQEQVEEIETRGAPSDHLTIYAPIGGIVIDKRLVEGAYVAVGTEIYTIADLSSVWVKFDAYELDLAWVHYGQHVEFAAEAYPGETFHGTIAFIDPILNDRTRTTKVRVNTPNEDGRLKPGMFVRAIVRPRLTAEGKVMDPALAGKWICPMHPEVIAEGPDECPKCGMPLVTAESLGYSSASPEDAEPPLVIPATAPLITGKRAIVYVARPEEPGRYEGREIVLGSRAADHYLVKEGLSEGEWVVTHGGLYLDSAVQIRGKHSMMQPQAGPAPPGHQHGSANASAPAAQTPQRGSPELKEQLTAVFDAYFEVHRALKADRLEPAQAAAKQLLQTMEEAGAAGQPGSPGDDWDSLRERLRSSSKGIASAPNIMAARASFEGASGAMITLANRFGIGDRERVFIYHCPMAFDNRGADWMQEKEGVENPYFGSVMFKCGVLKDVVPQASGPGAVEHAHD